MMEIVSLGEVLIEQKKTVGNPNGNGHSLIGVSNKLGLYLSRQEPIADLSRYKILEMNWFAYNPMRINIGSIGLADSPQKTGIISPDYVVFSCTERIAPEYFLYFIKSKVGLQEIGKNTGGSVRERLYFQNLAKIKIKLPTIKEQLRILKLLDNYKEQLFNIANESECVSLLIDEIKLALFEKAISGELTANWRLENSENLPITVLIENLRAQSAIFYKSKFKKSSQAYIEDYKAANPIPENWMYTHLKDTGSIYNGNSINKEEKSNNYTNLQSGYSYIATKDIEFSTGSIDYNNGIKIPFDKLGFKIAAKNSVLICSEGGSAGKKIAITERDVCFGNKLLVNSPFTGINTKYLLYFYKSPQFQGQFKEKMKGIIGGISIANFQNILIPVPAFEEQNEIVQVIYRYTATCDDIISELESSRKNVEILYEEILRKAFLIDVEMHLENTQGKNLSTNLDVLVSKATFDDTEKTLILASEIVWQLHKNPNLGHVKLQKLIFLCERTQQMGLPVNFLKQAMGPYDPRLQRYLDTEMQKKGWFRYDESQQLKYIPLENVGEHKNVFKAQFRDQFEAIYNIIQLFENANSARIEIIATLFACWEEMINEKQLVNDVSLLQKFYDWSEFKANYSNEQVSSALRWMEQNGIVPKHSAVLN